MTKLIHIKQLVLAGILVLVNGMVHGQCTSSDPSPVLDCGEYHWPIGVQKPCPSVIIKQKGDHHPDKEGDHRTLRRYRQRGWDTVVDCNHPSIVLSCTPYVPVQKFNGCYYVDPIPYNPPDTTFCFTLGAALQNMNDPNRKKMPISTDDDFAGSVTNIPYPFYFFGIRKNAFVLGANGLVTFNTSAAGQGCPWSYSASIPWPDGTSGAPGSTGLMRDAIYGVYEDTYPSPSIHTSGDPNWGIYYGVIDDYPCRKIICSWKDVPQFSCTSMRCTYQIVCYEGSNIVEVHVKQRQVCTSWNGGHGLIGIQNATGQPQVASTNPFDPNSLQSINGKPAAFYPTGYNTTQSNINNVAFRFTPQGSTDKFYEWFRVFDDGRPNYVLQNINANPAAQNDTNGYYIPMDETNPTCPTLTKAIVSPRMPSRYVFHLRFKNANNDFYDLYDTTFVGVDTLNYIRLHKQPVNDTFPSRLDICLGDTAKMRVDIHTLEEVAREEWSFYRISQGDTILLDTLVGANGLPPYNSYLSNGNWQQTRIFRLFGSDTIVLDTTLFTKDDYAILGDSIKTRAAMLFSARLPQRGLVPNKIDSIFIVLSADFVSGCHNYDTMLIRIFPNFEDTTVDGICRGDTYHWMPSDSRHTYHYTYTTDTDPATTKVTLESMPGCDSVVHLALTVFDVSYTTDYQSDCKPYRWQNGHVYTVTNTATAERDTVVLANRYGCDSIVQLNFTMHPLTAKLQSDVDHFDLDHLDAVLTDISIGGDSRVWKLPGAEDQTEAVVYYSIPVELDGAEILLIESSPYGCTDTAKIYIPLNKEHFWVPNAFTPDNPAGNNRFSSVSTRTLHQEMIIYNRRGELVFRCEGPDCEWDGRDLDGKPCVQGAYVYIIRYANDFEPEKTRVLHGTVTLIR